MTIKPLPPQDVLLSLLTYDPETGRLFHRARSVESFLGTSDPRGVEWASAAYNRRMAGREALTTSDRRGYRQGKVNGVNYQAHRIAWKMFYGEDPNIIDHINGDTSDNRIANLRSCTNEENCRNYRKPKGSSSKYRGVCWVKRDKAWAARISCGKAGKRSLGNFRDEVEAAKAYDAAAMELHGEFATLNFPARRIREALA